MVSKPTKVFYMIFSLTSGGIEKYSINLFRHINSKKYQLDFITKLDQREFFDQQLVDMGGKKISLYKPNSFGIFSRYFQLLFHTYKIAKQDYEIAYFNLSSPKDVFKYPLISRMAGIKKIIIHSHNSFSEKNDLLIRIVNSLGRKYINHIATERFACSDKAALWMYGKKVAQKKQYIFLQNGIESLSYKYNEKTRNSMRDNLGIGASDFVVGHIGRFEKQKNHVFLIKVFSKLIKKNNNSKLVLVGVGSLKKKIEKLVQDMGLKDNVIFLGERDDVPNILQVFDVFALPSLFEGLPLVGIEAQASDLPCVFSDAVSKESDITGNVTFLNLKVPVSEWADVLLNAKKSMRQSRQENLINAGYDIKHTASVVEKIFDQILLKP